ncbi:MAG: tetratricopeptide repeat protein [Pirellulales bacterium]|nr:tetratricopeptide repeat protein [Pirellulales bacterium]
MESNKRPESDASPVAETSRGWWKSPLRWPRQAVAGMKRIPALLGYLKNFHRWPGQLFALVAANKLTTLTVLASGIAILLPVLTFFFYRSARHRQAFGPPVKVEEVVGALERGDYAETKILAKRLMKQQSSADKDAGVAPYALGAVAVFEAEKMKGKNRQAQYLLASRYMAEAHAAGFPEARRAEGLYLYGKSLYEIGEFAKCRAVLLQAMKAAPRHKTEIYALLADASLSESKPDLAAAMAQNAIFLADKKLSAADRQQGLLLKARIQLRMDKLDECRATLKEIPENARNIAATMVVGGQIPMREAALLRGKDAAESESGRTAAREKYRAAIETLRLAENRAAAGSEAARRAMYSIGVCLMETGEDRAAADQFTRVRKVYPDSPEAVAALLQEAELSRRGGRNMEMLSEYRRALGAFDKSIPYHNAWIPPEELKTRLMNAYRQFQSKQQFEICVQLIGLLKPHIPAGQSLLMQGDLHAKWGQYLANSAEKAGRNKREPLRRLAREQFRRAGQNYAVLAKMNADKREYSDQVWNAATSYLQGRHYGRAAGLLREYLRYEVQRRRPQALDALGEALLSLGQYDAALESLKECIDQFPRDAAACHARLIAAQAAREKGDLAEAEKMLLANLNGDYLTPAGKEWRESLFFLGELLHGAGRYADAARRLEEAVDRYPALPETVFARYLLADSCSRLAYAMQDELKKDLSGSSRPTQMKLIRDNFEKALAQYRIVQEKLGGNRDLAELSPLDKTVLRNAIFAIGDVLYAEGEYESAVKAYDTAAIRYQNRPEVLDAYVQIANAYRRLGKPQDANNALRQAQLLLARMKPDVSFRETSIYSRAEWSKRLEELQRRG